MMTEKRARTVSSGKIIILLLLLLFNYCLEVKIAIEKKIERNAAKIAKSDF